MGLDFKFRQEGRISWQVGKQWCHMVLRATHVKRNGPNNCTCEITWEKLGIQTVLQERGPVRTRTLPDWWQPGGEVWDESRRRSPISGVNHCMWSVSMPVSMIGPWMCREAARFLRSDSGSIRFKTLRCRSPTRQTQVKNYYPMGYPNKSLTITIQLSNHV